MVIRVLGIETSCDETAIGIVEDGRIVRSNTVASSLTLHAPYGGVIPDIAARAHVEAVWMVLAQALTEAEQTLDSIDAIAVTQGPGLPGALLIGMAFAKGLALSLERPLVPVDHLAAHLYAGEMTEATLEPPYVGLVVSGGHTLLCIVHSDNRYERLGDTKDDAVGEAFDKVAKLLGLGYPGGPIIDRLSVEGNPKSISFPRAHTKGTFDFSFSGLKTAVYTYVTRTLKAAPPQRATESANASHPLPPPSLEPEQIANIAASFQETAVEALVTKTLRACQRTGLRRIVVGGGVASNRRLRSRFAELAAPHKLDVVFPPPALCVDNGAMIAGLACSLLQQGLTAPLSIATAPNQCLGVAA